MKIILKVMIQKGSGKKKTKREAEILLLNDCWAVGTVP